MKKGILKNHDMQVGELYQNWCGERRMLLGIWIMTANINHLAPYREGCLLYVNATSTSVTCYYFDNKSCDELAEEINRQIKANN